MRNRFRSTLPSKSDTDDNASTSKGLQDFLRETGVKFRRAGNNTVRIFNDAVFPPNFEISDNIVVDGTLTVDEHCVFYGSAKAKGNVILGNCVILMGNRFQKETSTQG